MNLAPLKNAFCDANGDLNMAEISVALGAGSGLAAFVWDCFGRGNHPDLSALGLFLGALVTSLGGAQALRGDRQRLKDMEGKQP